MILLFDWIPNKEELIAKIKKCKPYEFALQETIDEDSFMEGYSTAKLDILSLIQGEKDG